MTIGGNRINHPFDVSTLISDLVKIKMPWNSVLLMPGETIFGADIANFYLNTLMKQPEFMRLQYNIILTE